MIRALLAAALAATATTSAQAQEVTKEDYCGHTADVVGAIQQARLDRVKERDVPDIVLGSDPDWPDNYDGAVVQLTPWVYQQKMRDVRKEDLSAAWKQVFVANWDSFKDQLK